NCLRNGALRRHPRGPESEGLGLTHREEPLTGIKAIRCPPTPTPTPTWLPRKGKTPRSAPSSSWEQQESVRRLRADVPPRSAFHFCDRTHRGAQERRGSAWSLQRPCGERLSALTQCKCTRGSTLG